MVSGNLYCLGLSHLQPKPKGLALQAATTHHQAAPASSSSLQATPSAATSTVPVDSSQPPASII